MKILIVYESITGNTKEVAESIYQALRKDHKVGLINVVDALEGGYKDDADLYFLGSWTNKGSCGNLMKEYVKGLKNKKIANFGTVGFGDSRYYQRLTNRFFEVLGDSNTLIDSFYCQGRMREVVRDRYLDLLKDHPDDESLEVKIQSFDEASFHPNQKDLNKAKDFALNVISKL